MTFGLKPEGEYATSPCIYGDSVMVARELPNLFVRVRILVTAPCVHKFMIGEEDIISY